MSIWEIDGDRYSVEKVDGWVTVSSHQLRQMYGMSVIYDRRHIPIFGRADIPREYIPMFRKNYEAIFGPSVPKYTVKISPNSQNKSLYINDACLMGCPYNCDLEYRLLMGDTFAFNEYCKIPHEHAEAVLAALWANDGKNHVKKI